MSEAPLSTPEMNDVTARWSPLDGSVFHCHSKPGGEGARDWKMLFLAEFLAVGGTKTTCCLAGKLNKIRKGRSVGIAFSLCMSLYSKSMEDLVKNTLLNIFKYLSLMLDIYPSQLTSISLGKYISIYGRV